MDGKSFRRLCATLGSLTGPQLKELRAALRSLDARMQAIGAIEKRREGSREWVRHQRDPVNHPKPDRMRWVDYKRTGTKLPAGISKYQIPVLTMADRAGARRADVLPDHSAPPLMAVLARCLRGDAVLRSDRDPAYDFFARRNGVPHYRIDAKKGPFVINRAFHIQTINSLHDRFERFMDPRRFRPRGDPHLRLRRDLHRSRGGVA